MLVSGEADVADMAGSETERGRGWRVGANLSGAEQSQWSMGERRKVRRRRVVVVVHTAPRGGGKGREASGPVPPSAPTKVVMPQLKYGDACVGLQSVDWNGRGGRVPICLYSIFKHMRSLPHTSLSWQGLPVFSKKVQILASHGSRNV